VGVVTVDQSPTSGRGQEGPRVVLRLGVDTAVAELHRYWVCVAVDRPLARVVTAVLGYVQGAALESRPIERHVEQQTSVHCAHCNKLLQC